MIAEAKTPDPETEAPQKPHFSPTQLNMIAVCGIQYQFRYCDGIIMPPGVALLKGGALHKGAEHNMRQKLESHRDLPADQIVQAAVAEFESKTNGSYALTDEEAARGAGVVLGEAKDSVAAMAQCHAEKQAPDYQPTMVEEHVRIELPGPRDLLGIIDLADTQDRITDFKTAKRKKRQDEADTSLQLTTYAAAFQAKTGREPSEVRLDSVVQTKTKIDRQVLSSQRTVADIQVLANRINAAAGVVQAGAFMPAPLGAWQCSLKFCGYARICPYFNSERAAMAEQFDSE